MPRVDRNAPAGMPGVGTQSDDNSVATVRVGETTLSDVAKRLNLDPGALLTTNPRIADRTRLTIGQEIRLPQLQTSQTQGHDSASLIGNQPSAPDLTPAPMGDSVAMSAMQATLDAKTGGASKLAGATTRLHAAALVTPFNTLHKAMEDSLSTQKAANDLIVSVKNVLDSMGEMGETESLRLQMTMDRLSKMMSTLSNLLKKMNDTADGITRNLK
jgi:methyl-accepting chemotaxis protein